MSKTVWIIGTGTAGTSAAVWGRKIDRTATIYLVGSEPYSEYSRCGLPYTISGEIPQFENLIIRADAWYTERAKINLMLNTKVEKVNTKNRTLIIKNLKTGEEKEEHYDSLIFATGSIPKVPPIKGTDNRNVLFLHTIDDAKKIKELARKGVKAVIIGAGLIGMELSEALNKLDVKVWVVEFLESILPAMIDPDMGTIIKKKAEAEGIEFYLSSAAKEIVDEGNKLIVKGEKRDTKAEFSLEADFVVIATGMKPNTELARASGIELGPLGGIKVNERMQTNVENVYAAGDCIEYNNMITNQPVLAGLGTLAEREGRVAGINAVGGDAKLPKLLLNRTTRMFGYEVAAVGLLKHQAEKAGLNPVVAKIKEKDKEHYYPDWEEVTVKLIGNGETSEMLGAQVIGRNAALRVDIITTAIMNKMTPKDIVDIETCYAPPVAPVWDPIAIAAMTLNDKIKAYQRRKMRRRS